MVIFSQFVKYKSFTWRGKYANRVTQGRWYILSAAVQGSVEPQFSAQPCGGLGVICDHQLDYKYSVWSHFDTYLLT